MLEAWAVVALLSAPPPRVPGPQDGKYCFNNVKRWSASRGLDVFDVDWILVPIHLPSHWALAVIDMRTREGECRSQADLG